MQRGPILSDRPDFFQIGGVIFDRPRLCGSDLPTFIPPHRRESSHDDLVSGLAPRSPDRQN